MIEISNICAVNKGSLLATCDVYIQPWDMELREVKVFQKGENRWLGMPSKEFINSLGEKKYVELIDFRRESTKNNFRRQIVVAVDKFLLENPDMKPTDVIKEDDQMPF